MLCITNMVSGTKEQTRFLVKKNVIGALKVSLNSFHVANQEQAFWALGNIAADDHKFRDLIIKEGKLKFN